METSGATLARELGALGITVTERKLTDWVYKDLLPPRTQRGRGRAGGKEYFWTQPDIRSQAIAVYQLLAWCGRSDRAYLPLWLMGFQVPLRIVKGSLAGPLIAASEHRAASGLTNDDLAAEIEALAENRTRRKNRVAGAVQVPCSITSLYLNAITNPKFKPVAEQWQDVREDLHRIGLTEFNENQLGQWLGFLREYASTDQLLKACSRAEDRDWARVQSDFRRLYRAVKPLQPHFSEPEVWPHFLFGLLTRLGPWLALTDLCLRLDGFNDEVEQVVTYCECFLGEWDVYARGAARTTSR